MTEAGALAALAPELPPADRALSPYTGWTRAHWEHLADRLLAGVRPYATARHALLHLPRGRESVNGRRSDGLEGYARTFLLAAFRLGGAGGAAPGDLATRYAEGLAAGTDPASDEAWPAITPGSQPMVEAASVALALYETRPWIWDALPDAVRQRAVSWLAGSLGKPHHPNNWLLFQVIVNAFLASVGADHRPAEVREDLDRIDAWYRRDGWYTDGPGQSYDHYVGWAMHLYTLLWCRMGGERVDPARAARYRERAGRFLADFAHLFAADGAPLHQGRSLIYRFAAAAAPWAGALLGATPLAPGETRRLASGCLRHFLERGAAHGGVLSMGWYGEHLPMAQRYSGPASPYWASKGFLGLLLPPHHPVWTTVEAPLPVERGDFVRAMPEPGFLAFGTVRDGIVRVASHRSDHQPGLLGRADDPHYRKLVYATHAAPETGEAGDASDADAQVSLVGSEGVPSRRTRIHPIAVADVFAASYFHPHETAVIGGRAVPLFHERVETVAVARGAMEIRLHAASVLAADLRLRDGGAAIGDDAPLAAETGPGYALVRRRDGLTSLSFGLFGFGAASVQTLERSHAHGAHSAAPLLWSAAPVGAEAVLGSAHVLARGDLDPGALRAEVAGVAVSGRCVELAFRDGARIAVQLVAPEPLRLDWNGRRIEGPFRFVHLRSDGSLFTL